MITKESLKEQIGKLQIEQATLQTRHDTLVKDFQLRQAEFQQVVAGNQNRFQQITGSIQSLTELLKTLDPPETPPA